MGQTVAVVNQKGGVGKTTVTLGLASAAMERGHRVLVVDLDPQGAAGWVLGVDRARRTVCDVISSGRPGAAGAAIMRSEWSHLVDVIASSPDLQDLEVLRGGLEAMLRGNRAETRLRRGLEEAVLGYGVVLIDCPPSLGALTTSGLAASDQALLVVEPTALSLRGVEPVSKLIETTWERHNPELDLAGVVVNKMPARSSDAVFHSAELERAVGRTAVWDPPIPNRVAVAEAAAQRLPIHAMGARGRAPADAFDALYARLWQQIKPART